jgi:inorganic pyrophosphatase
VHRDNDVEDKLVAVPLAVSLSREQIAEQIHFQEQYFNSWIELVTD